MKIQLEQIQWVGDMGDDCCARWNGLLLRAEWQNGEARMPSGGGLSSASKQSKNSIHQTYRHIGQALAKTQENVQRPQLDPGWR